MIKCIKCNSGFEKDHNVSWEKDSPYLCDCGRSMWIKLAPGKRDDQPQTAHQVVVRANNQKITADDVLALFTLNRGGTIRLVTRDFLPSIFVFGKGRIPHGFARMAQEIILVDNSRQMATTITRINRIFPDAISLVKQAQCPRCKGSGISNYGYKCQCNQGKVDYYEISNSVIAR